MVHSISEEEKEIYCLHKFARLKKTHAALKKCIIFCIDFHSKTMENRAPERVKIQRKVHENQVSIFDLKTDAKIEQTRNLQTLKSSSRCSGSSIFIISRVSNLDSFLDTFCAHVSFHFVSGVPSGSSMVPRCGLYCLPLMLSRVDQGSMLFLGSLLAPPCALFAACDVRFGRTSKILY